MEVNLDPQNVRASLVRAREFSAQWVFVYYSDAIWRLDSTRYETRYLEDVYAELLVEEA